MHIKTLIRGLIKHIIINDTFWIMGLPIFKKVPYLVFLRRQAIKDNHAQFIDSFFKDLIVKNGIFKGLKYPKLESSGSAIYPKLLGSYEAELNEVLEEILSASPTTLIDIGCAEGYYLAGFAMRIKNINLIGIDISKVALTQTQKILKENDIDLKNVSLLQKFDIALIPKMPIEKVVVICDCEGYEKVIFNPDFSTNFSNCILLIECHDFIEPNITEILTKTLNPTHHIEIIKSIVDETSKFGFIPLTLQKLDFEEKVLLVKEGRPTSMSWIYAKPKNSL